MTSLLTVGPWRLRSPVSNNTIYHTHDSDFVVKIIPAPCQATDEEIVPELEVLLAVLITETASVMQPSFRSV